MYPQVSYSKKRLGILNPSRDILVSIPLNQNQNYTRAITVSFLFSAAYCRDPARKRGLLQNMCKGRVNIRPNLLVYVRKVELTHCSVGTEFILKSPKFYR
jgi:hypothetical protein